MTALLESLNMVPDTAKYVTSVYFMEASKGRYYHPVYKKPSWELAFTWA